MARQREQPPSSNWSTGGNAQRGRVKKRAEPDIATDSQCMLSLPQILTEPKSDDNELKEFGTKVAADQCALKALLQQRLRDAEKNQARRHSEMVSIITAALQSSKQQSPGNTAMAIPKTKIAGSPALEYTDRMNSKCQSLLKEYETFETMISQLAGEQKELIRDTWTEDVQKTEALLKLGYKTSLRRMRKSLGVEGDDKDERMHDADDELAYDLKDILSYTERGIKRMVKALPTEEVEWE